uniref:Uncharacterized protein n=1 Tax=Rhizophora mucronata TaxID=61149 RepID=A0A2P2JI57_RHIMU
MIRLSPQRHPCQWSYHPQFRPPPPPSLFHPCHRQWVPPHFQPSWIAVAILSLLYLGHPAFESLQDMDQYRHLTWKSPTNSFLVLGQVLRDLDK